MNDRVETLIGGRRERLQRLLLRPLEEPRSERAPLPEESRTHLMEYARELYWNELEWENITEEEATEGGPAPELVFPGFLAYVRGLLLKEAMEDSLAPAEPRPEVVREILRFLAGRVVELEEALEEEPDEIQRVRAELATTDHLLDLVLYLYHDLSEAEVERLEERRLVADQG